MAKRTTQVSQFWATASFSQRAGGRIEVIDLDEADDWGLHPRSFIEL